jgi:hypothetical protein
MESARSASALPGGLTESVVFDGGRRGERYRALTDPRQRRGIR